MSRSRSKPRRTPTLSDDAILAPDDGLRGLAATSYHTFNRRSGRLAVTILPAARAPSRSLPDSSSSTPGG